MSKFFRNFQGIQNLWSKSIYLSKTIRIRSVQTWRISFSRTSPNRLFGTGSPWQPPGSPGARSSVHTARPAAGQWKPWDFPWKNIGKTISNDPRKWSSEAAEKHCPTSSTSRATESSRAHALFHVFYILHSYSYTHIIYNYTCKYTYILLYNTYLHIYIIISMDILFILYIYTHTACNSYLWTYYCVLRIGWICRYSN